MTAKMNKIAFEDIYSLHCNKNLCIQLLKIPNNLSRIYWSNISHIVCKHHLKSYSLITNITKVAK